MMLISIAHAHAARLNADEAQARDDGNTLIARLGLQTRHSFAIVALGFEGMVWRSVVVAQD